MADPAPSNPDPFLKGLPALTEDQGEAEPGLQNYARQMFLTPELEQFVELVVRRAKDGMNSSIRSPKNSGYDRLIRIIEAKCHSANIDSIKIARMFSTPTAFLRHIIQHFYKMTKTAKKDQIALSGTNPDPLYEAAMRIFAEHPAVILLEEPIESDGKADKSLLVMVRLCEKTKLRYCISYDGTVDNFTLRMSLINTANRVNFPKLSYARMRDYILALIRYEKTHTTAIPLISPEYSGHNGYISKLAKMSAPYVGRVYVHASKPPATLMKTSRWNYLAQEEKGERIIPTIELKWPLIYISSFAIIGRAIHQSADNVDKIIVYGPFFTLAVILFFALRLIPNDDYRKRGPNAD